ncbi:MAG: argininosuccinate lyase [Anaerolineales bacterium]|nr:argininosuccinate lyase [Anaerolineales bacterium]
MPAGPTPAPPPANDPAGRLAGGPAPELVATAYLREVRDQVGLYRGMSQADLAHVVMLLEAGLVPREAGGALLAALLAMHPDPPLDFVLDPAQGDLYSNREAYLRMLTPAAGWLSVGRARREATTVGWRLAVRERLLALAGALAQCAQAVLIRAEAERATLFPDYTYLQPAQPTTFGHYLLTFAYPLLRDLDRLRAAYPRANASPAGSGSVNGSRLPLDRGRLADLLGCDTVITHTRDAMWQADGPIELAALISAALVNLDRLAEDLQLFATAEFGLVALADRHSRTSVIMPQKKNPYALAYLRGLCGEAIGTLAAMAAVGKTPSGQIDSRLFVYGTIPRALDSTAGAARLMTDVVRGLQVDAGRSTRRAAEDFLGATDLAEVVMLHAGLDYKTAHGLVARAVREALETGATTLSAGRLDAAALAMLGRPLGLTPEAVAEALDPARIVAARSGLGGAALPAVMQMIAECREALADHARWRAQAEARLAAAETGLLMAVAAHKLAGARPAEEATPSEPGADSPGAHLPAGAPPELRQPPSLDDIADFVFKDLPRPPNRRRWSQ